MSLRDCIATALKDGDITPEQAERVTRILDEELAAARADLGDSAAAAEADKRGFERLAAEVDEAKRRTLLMEAAADRVRARILARRNQQDLADPAGELSDLIEHFGTSPNSSVMSRYEAVLGKAHGMMRDVLLKFERDALSRTRNKAELRNLVREAFGEDTGDASARELATAWEAGADYLRRRRNSAGGNTAKLDRWGMPTSHDQIAVGRLSAREWADFVKPRLERARMLDRNTGLPLSDARLDEMLLEVHEAISSQGWSRREANFAGGGMSLARRRQEARVLQWRDADAWMEYADALGNGDPFSVMMRHVDEMSREIAAMEVLGPNPRAMLRFAEGVAIKEASEGRAEARSLFDRITPGRSAEGLTSRVKAEAGLMRRMYALFDGTAYAPADSKLARTVGTVVNFKVSTQLGSAALSAISDVTYQKAARRFNGIPEAGAIRGMLKTFDPRNAEHQRLALRAGLGAEGAAQVMLAQARYVGEFHGHEWSSRMADVTLRVSGLSPWTQAGKWAHGLSFMGHMGDIAGEAFGDLKPETRRMFERYGFSAQDWDLIRSADRAEAGLILPEAIEAAGGDPARAQAVAERYLEMVMTEEQFAVPSATLRGQAYFMPEGLKPGTFMHTLVRSVTMYKSFPTSVLLLFGSRSRAEAARAGAMMGARFAARVAISATVLGALAIQLKEISKGRDPRPMDTSEFWGAALLQGGGLGLFGDFLFADVNRFGGGLGVSIAGPLVQTADDLRKLTIGNAIELAQGEDTNAGAELTRFLRGNTPGGSIWYLRLAYERIFLDELQEQIDPDAAASFRRIERRYARDYEQDYWWRPGEPSPDRPPDPGNIMGP